MKVTGIIAEYNPFHKGHEYHINQSKIQTGADYTVIAMSGNFLQRGEAACVDKFKRVKMALSHGADLVLELPVSFATASAPDFARGGTKVLQEAGITHLSFGSEAGNLKHLQYLADFFTHEPEDFKGILTQKLKSGMSYPKARALAFGEYLNGYSAFSSEDIHSLCEILDNPNNILAIAYLRSLKENKSPIQPLTIARSGGGYHELSLEKGFASATAIRSLLEKGWLPEELQEHLPTASFSLLKDHLVRCPMVDNNRFSSQLYYKLVTSDPEEWKNYAGISPQLADRMKKNLSSFTTFTDFTKTLKRKNDSYTAISRGLIHLLLGIKEEECSSVPYLRILGFQKSAVDLLHRIKETSNLPLVTKPADAKYLLDKKALALFEKELLSEQIYHSAYQHLPDYIPYDPYKNTPVIL